MKALLIIDMQKISFTPLTPRHDTSGVVDRINSLADKFRKEGAPVIFILHDGSQQGYCIPQTSEWELLSSLKVEIPDLTLSKTANDAFYRTTLKEDLVKMKVDNLVVTGCATDFCVDSTIKSALTHDFKVTVISNAHTTADRPNLSAQQVIGHYNWIWKEMIPTGGEIEVVDFDSYMKAES